MEVGVRLCSSVAAYVGWEDIMQQLSEFGPVSWAALSGCIWLSYLFTQRWPRMGRWDRYQLVWGLVSILHFLYWALVVDTDFKVRGAGAQLPQCCSTLTMVSPIWGLTPP